MTVLSVGGDGISFAASSLSPESHDKYKFHLRKYVAEMIIVNASFSDAANVMFWRFLTSAALDILGNRMGVIKAEYPSLVELNLFAVFLPHSNQLLILYSIVVAFLRQDDNLIYMKWPCIIPYVFHNLILPSPPTPTKNILDMN